MIPAGEAGGALKRAGGLTAGSVQPELRKERKMAKRVSLLRTGVLLAVFIVLFNIKCYAYPPAYPVPALTGNQALDIANIAASQIGYAESDGTVYGAWWNGVTNWGHDYTNEGWCAMFACWCADQAGAGLYVAYDKNGAMPGRLFDYLKANGAAYDTTMTGTPMTGDFIFFGNDRVQHVAIVTGFDEATRVASLVGGNQKNGAVSASACSYVPDSIWGYQRVLGFGRPRYTTGADTEPPVISDIQVAADSAGYTVTCRVTDNDAVSQVRFPTWTTYGDQDDLLKDWGTNEKALGTTSNGITSFRVDRADHNNELGTYVTDIYAYDRFGNVSTGRVIYTFEQTASVTITSQPQDREAEENETAVFSVGAEGPVASYQWQYKIAGTTRWRNSTSATSGYNTAELHVVAAPSRNGYQYRCRVTDENGKTVTSDAAVLTVIERTVRITMQPQDAEAAVGETARFTVAAEGDGLVYEWQYKIAGTTKWRNSTSATPGYNTPELRVVGTAARNGFQYRCIVTDSNGNSVVSSAATLRITGVKIASDPQDQTVEAGQTARFTVTAYGEGLTYQWQYKIAGTSKWRDSSPATAGYNTAELEVVGTVKRNGYQYRCVVSDASGKTLTSKAAALTVE